MRETLKMMRSIIVGYESNVTINELLEEYKLKQSPNVLAYLYVTNYGAIEHVSQAYKLLDTQDIASFALQELDKAILNYNFDSNCKFIPFFLLCFKNRLRAEQEFLFHNVRFANYFTESLDVLTNTESDFKFDTFNPDDYNLTSEEKLQSKLLIDGYSIKEISDIFNVSKVTIYNRNKIIGKKLLY